MKQRFRLNDLSPILNAQAVNIPNQQTYQQTTLLVGWLGGWVREGGGGGPHGRGGWLGDGKGELVTTLLQTCQQSINHDNHQQSINQYANQHANVPAV
jgi:hypothetical protein